MVLVICMFIYLILNEELIFYTKGHIGPQKGKPGAEPKPELTTQGPIKRKSWEDYHITHWTLMHRYTCQCFLTLIFGAYFKAFLDNDLFLPMAFL